MVWSAYLMNEDKQIFNPFAWIWVLFIMIGIGGVSLIFITTEAYKNE